MKIRITIVLLALSSAFAFGQNDFSKELEKANALYGSKQHEDARVWYEKAAEKGSADANFYLAYRYTNPEEKTKSYYATAAKLGHSEALSYALEYMFFRATDLVSVDPVAALNLYRQAKALHPSISFYNEEGAVSTLEIAASIPKLDGAAFIEKYNLLEDENFGAVYYIWELAAAASRGERFENPSSELVMQLIVRGGFVPAEIQGAIQDYYAMTNASDSLVEFRVCDYVTSGMGLTYCAQKWEVEQDISTANEIEELKTSFGLRNSLLDTAYSATMSFLDSKVWNEEGHDGSGYALWAQSSLSEQSIKYIDFMTGITEGVLPSVSKSLQENDRRLNVMYKEIISDLEANPIHSNRFTIDAKGIRKTQRLWLNYRDANTALLVVVSNQKDSDFWSNYFTIERLEQFASLKERISWE